MRPMLTASLLALVACQGTDLVAPDGVAAACGDSAPVIEALLVEEGDPFVIGGEEVPGMFVNVTVSDADGDLHWFEMRLWWDDVIDGAVEPGPGYYEAYGPRGDLDCDVQRTQVPFRIAVNGQPPANRDIEVGVIVYDDMHNPSNEGVPVVQAWRTPASAR